MNVDKFTPLFYFMNENVTLVEVEVNGLSTETPLSERFHWLKFSKDSKEIVKLKFQSMSTEMVNGNEINVRVFEGSELRFDKNFAKFQFENNGHLIMNKPVTEIPTKIREMLDSYIG